MLRLIVICGKSQLAFVANRCSYACDSYMIKIGVRHKAQTQEKCVIVNNIAERPTIKELIRPEMIYISKCQG